MVMQLERYKIDSNQKIDLALRHTDLSDKPTDIEAEIKANIDSILELQQRLMAEEKQGIIFILQAMDAAGKDEAERYLFSMLSAQGLHTTSFGKPSEEELAHDYLWRLHKAMPERGQIAVFNRSHYEEVIGTRLNEAYLDSPLPDKIKNGPLFAQRYQQINGFEDYLYYNGFRTVKIFLHVSKESQKARFIDRIEKKERQWEFSMSDLDDRLKWQDFMAVFAETIEQTSTTHSPWYIIPADDGEMGRLIISEILRQTLIDMDPQYPKLTAKEEKVLETVKNELINGKYDKG